MEGEGGVKLKIKEKTEYFLIKILNQGAILVKVLLSYVLAPMQRKQNFRQHIALDRGVLTDRLMNRQFQDLLMERNFRKFPATQNMPTHSRNFRALTASNKLSIYNREAQLQCAVSVVLVSPSDKMIARDISCLISWS